MGNDYHLICYYDRPIFFKNHTVSINKLDMQNEEHKEWFLEVMEIFHDKHLNMYM